jgi:hypothetical protein
MTTKKSPAMALVLWAWVCFITVVHCGCVNVYKPFNRPSQQKLRVLSPSADQYHLEVIGKTNYPVPVDGRITVDIPRIGHGYALYLFGVLKVKDRPAEDLTAILLTRNQRIVLRLTLNDIYNIQMDKNGYRNIVMK